jgi:hypothetical protein
MEKNRKAVNIIIIDLLILNKIIIYQNKPLKDNVQIKINEK